MSPTKSSKPRKRRKFTPEFKAEAVRIALTPRRHATATNAFKLFSGV